MEKPEFLQTNLRRSMDSKGWSIKKLAIESGVSYHTVFRAVSHGVVPRISNLKKMARALDTTVSDLQRDPATPPYPKLSDLARIDARILEKLESMDKRLPPSPLPLNLVHAWEKASEPQKLLAMLFLATNQEEIHRFLREAEKVLPEPVFREVEKLLANFATKKFAAK